MPIMNSDSEKKIPSYNSTGGSSSGKHKHPSGSGKRKHSSSSSSGMDESGTATNYNHSYSIVTPSQTKKETQEHPNTFLSEKSKPTLLKRENSWDAEEEEMLMILALEELESAQIEKEGSKMDDKSNNNHNNGVSDVTTSSGSSNSDEDWDIIDWDAVAQSLHNRSPVECLKKYLKLKKK